MVPRVSSLSVLIIGKRPPPIGGVTIHVERLLAFLEGQPHLTVSFHALSLRHLFRLPGLMLKSQVVHLHASHPAVRCLLAVVCRILRRPLVITYHGNLGRFGTVKNMVDRISVRLASAPVVLNGRSLTIARRLNGQSRMISAFIPPSASPVPEQPEQALTHFSSKHSANFATNAFNLAFDSEGREIYGISQLVSLFQAHCNWGLIVSDPSGRYAPFIAAKLGPLPSNVLFITYPHEFVHVLERATCMIRATTTDGDSLSVREALQLGVPVVASDCVDRPEGVRLYQSDRIASLDEALASTLNQGRRTVRPENQKVGDQLVSLYASLVC